MRTICFIALAVFASTASAHDFWIEPSTFRPNAGQNFTASLRVGQDFAGDAVPRSAQLIDAFTVSDRGQTRPVFGFENEDPAGILRLDRAGLAIIGYRSKAYPLELPAAKFEEFLHTEGLQKISEWRAKRGESLKPDRENFFRYAKAIVVAGDTNATGFDRRLGYRYEIIPETNPMAGGPLVVRVMLDGKPLGGALVKALQQQNPALRLTARSDTRGRVTFKLPSAGVWLVESVQMVPAPAGANVDWESLWASLTFER